MSKRFLGACEGEQQGRGRACTRERRGNRSRQGESYDFLAGLASMKKEGEERKIGQKETELAGKFQESSHKLMGTP